MKRRILAILMTACMVLTMIPGVAFAEQAPPDIPEDQWGDTPTLYPAAEVNVKEGSKSVFFSDPDNAVKYVNENGGTIYLYSLGDKDIEFSDRIVFENAKEITLDLSKLHRQSGEKTICLTKDVYINDDTTLTIKGGNLLLNSNPNSLQTYGNTIHARGTLIVDSTATIKSGTKDAIRVGLLGFTFGTAIIRGKVIAEGRAIVAYDGGFIRVDGSYGRIDAQDYYQAEVEAKGNAIVVEYQADLRVVNGIVKSTDGTAIVQTGHGSDVEIVSGEIKGNVNAIKTLAGNLKIDTSGQYSPIKIEAGSDAIVIHKGIKELEISGKDGYPMVKSNSADGRAVKTYGTIFNGFITSGTYSSDVSAFVADGYKSTKVSDNWVVEKITEEASTYNVKVIGTKFVDIGLPIRPLVRVTKGGEYVSPLDYTVEYVDNIKPGMATVNIYVGDNEEPVATTYFKIDKGLSLFQNSYKNTDTLLSNNSPTLQLKDASSEQKDAALTDSSNVGSEIKKFYDEKLYPFGHELSKVLNALLSEAGVYDQIKIVANKIEEIWNEILTAINANTQSSGN